MPVLQQKQTIHIETSLSLEEVSERIVHLVDFDYHRYRSTALIAKDFFGDQLGPGKFGIRKRPVIPGLFDVFNGVGPYIEIEVQQGRVRIAISHGGYLPSLTVIVVLLGLAFGYAGNLLPGLSMLQLIFILLLAGGLSAVIMYLFTGRYRSVKRMVIRKLIETLSE